MFKISRVMLTFPSAESLYQAIVIDWTPRSNPKFLTVFILTLLACNIFNVPILCVSKLILRFVKVKKQMDLYPAKLTLIMKSPENICIPLFFKEIFLFLIQYSSYLLALLQSNTISSLHVWKSQRHS